MSSHAHRTEAIASQPEVSLDLEWRPITPDDLPAWHRLEQAIEVADQPGERFTIDDLRDEMQVGSWKDPQHDSLIAVDRNGVARAFGWVEVRPGDTRTLRAFCWGGVHPQWRRRGVGTALLAWQRARAEQKIAARRAAVGNDVPGRMQVTCEDTMPDRIALLERHGFAPVRYFVDMRRRLRGPRAEPVPDVQLDAQLRVVPFTVELDEAVRLAHNEAFADHWGSEPRTPEDWALWTTGHRDFRADWSFVAMDGDAVAGYTLSAAYPQDWEAQGYSAGWTSLLGVRSRWRGRHLAPALQAVAMRAFAAAGMDSAELCVDTENTSGALDLYTRLGYEAERTTVAFGFSL